MKKKKIKEVMDKLLAEIEEEDIGISLFSTFYQNQADLCFFKAEDQERVLKILKKLSDDSKRHKEILEKIINVLGEKLYEK
ncbi:MAG: hypothetical protein HYZ84_04660 [Candidatus Omnitrophica bacterium]|nr:hypothetical protein [Candidatus Omnitrophota bacterium]